MKNLYNQFKDKTIAIDKMKNINILRSEKDDKSEEKYTDMPYLETEEEAAERLADCYERIKKMIQVKEKGKKAKRMMITKRVKKVKRVMITKRVKRVKRVKR